jgi:hypothetical protein
MDAGAGPRSENFSAEKDPCRQDRQEAAPVRGRDAAEGFFHWALARVPNSHAARATHAASGLNFTRGRFGTSGPFFFNFLPGGDMTIGHSVTRTIVSIGLAAFAVFWSGAGASAAHRHHYYHRGRAVESQSSAYRLHDGRPRAWCGWYMRQQVGADPGVDYNLARNWAHWGHATSPGIGVVVVWYHHVGKITGGSPGHWIVTSGNDGNRVRTRELSVAHAIAFREGGGGFDTPRLYAYADEHHRPRRQEAYLQQRHYAGADVYRPDYH